MKFRQHKGDPNITELLQRIQDVNIPELASLFGSSEMTIRRDLDLLAEQGFVRRL